MKDSRTRKTSARHDITSLIGGTSRRLEGAARSTSKRNTIAKNKSKKQTLFRMANLRNASMPVVLVVLGLIALTATMAAAGTPGAGGAEDDPTTGTMTDIPVLEPGNEGAADDTSDGGERVRQIKFGETVKLDDIGPIIVNEDCSMRRIANWDTLTERERNGVQRRIAARNRGRLEHCRKLEDQGKLRRPLDVHDDFAPSARNPHLHIEEVSVASILVDDHDEL